MRSGFRPCYLAPLLALLCATGCGKPGAPELVWGKRGINGGDLVKPRAIAIDKEDRLYLVDWTARIQVFNRDGKFLDCLAFSPDGQLLAGCNPGPACVWETATGKLLRKFGEGREGTRAFVDKCKPPWVAHIERSGEPS